MLAVPLVPAGMTCFRSRCAVRAACAWLVCVCWLPCCTQPAVLCWLGGCACSLLPCCSLLCSRSPHLPVSLPSAAVLEVEVEAYDGRRIKAYTLTTHAKTAQRLKVRVGAAVAKLYGVQ